MPFSLFLVSLPPPSAFSHRLLLVVSTLYITLFYRTRVTTRATITYTRYTIREMPSARTHLTHRRYAIRHGCNVRERSNAPRAINTGSPLRGGVSGVPAPYNPFSFVSLSLFPSFLFLSFCFHSFVSKMRGCHSSRAGRRGREGRDSERMGEGAGGRTTRGGI